MKPDKVTVILDRLQTGQRALTDQFSRAIGTLGMDLDFKDARAVFIKPNLTYPEYAPGVTTRLEFVAGLVEALRHINKTTRIYIGESEGGYNSFSMTTAMENMGFYSLAEKFDNVAVVNLSDTGRQETLLRIGRRHCRIELPTLFEEVDFSITCPLPKVHCMTGISLALKNQWGCLPDTMRLQNHYLFADIIAPINARLKFKYAFLDGAYGLDQNGPMAGEVVKLDWFVAANCLYGHDRIVSDLMGFSWHSIKHIRKSVQTEYPSGCDDIQVIGDPERLKRKFYLQRNFWNYPALAAFQSKTLTWLFYLSPVSGILHDIMYLFRKRPI